ncbi:unnamed protein product [Phytophthora fragariaefolia]|uniref:Unnamed protein product n=1 Tax=Phytophthora fragariaefolia TaxID=1490495 RepID=A0A9W6Y9J9_9STRA|nr:unnamed protein product [Phytophthora fragariaefolia]
MHASAIPRAADTPSKKVVQTVDGQKIVRVCDARLAYGDIVGDENLSGRLMSAGPILDMIDRFAGALAENVTVDQAIATVSIDRVDIKSPIAHGDLLQLEGEVIHTGRSSMVIQVGANLPFAAMVCCLANASASTLRPRPGLPKLVHLTDPDYVPRNEIIAKQRKELAMRWKSMQQKVDELPHVSVDMIQNSRSYPSELMPMQDTLIEIQTTFLPKNLNPNNTVFGGDVLAFMVQCVVCQRSCITSLNRAFRDMCCRIKWPCNALKVLLETEI